MSKIYQAAYEFVGGTPLLEPRRLEQTLGLSARLLCKLEYMNPAGSTKDRAAKNMIEDAEQSGRLQPGAVIIEPTSGNTGIGLAMVAAAKGYRLVIVMPETMSVERQKLMQAYGAELILTEGSRGMQGAIEKAEELAAATPGSFLAGQFVNPANPQAHYAATGPEIWTDTDGNVDFFVAGVGTGGTITGAGRYLKEQNPAVRVVAVEPATSAVLSGGKAGPHGLQGIGAGFVPAVLDTSVYDEVMAVSDEEAYAAARLLGKTARKRGQNGRGAAARHGRQISFDLSVRGIKQLTYILLFKKGPEAERFRAVLFVSAHFMSRER